LVTCDRCRPAGLPLKLIVRPADCCRREIAGRRQR